MATPTMNTEGSKAVSSMEATVRSLELYVASARNAADKLSGAAWRVAAKQADDAQQLLDVQRTQLAQMKTLVYGR